MYGNANKAGGQIAFGSCCARSWLKVLPPLQNIPGVVAQ